VQAAEAGGGHGDSAAAAVAAAEGVFHSSVNKVSRRDEEEGRSASPGNNPIAVCRLLERGSCVSVCVRACERRRARERGEEGGGTRRGKERKRGINKYSHPEIGG
jgi:hypothetical protein